MDTDIFDVLDIGSQVKLPSSRVTVPTPPTPTPDYEDSDESSFNAEDVDSDSDTYAAKPSTATSRSIETHKNEQLHDNSNPTHNLLSTPRVAHTALDDPSKTMDLDR